MYTLQAVFGATSRRIGVFMELNLFVTLVTALYLPLTVKVKVIPQQAEVAQGVSE